MKTIVLSLTAALAFSVSARAADATVKISDVHLCCKSCVTGVEKAVGGVPGVTVAVDKDARTVSLTGPNTATVHGRYCRGPTAT
jgi:copper chaperone CopZ